MRCEYCDVFSEERGLCPYCGAPMPDDPYPWLEQHSPLEGKLYTSTSTAYVPKPSDKIVFYYATET